MAPCCDLIGAPQIAALFVLAQRGVEELYSARNTRRARGQPAPRGRSTYYPVVAATHLAWIASLFFLIRADRARSSGRSLSYYLLLQVVRYWVIASLGRYWTHRIIDPPRVRQSSAVAPTAICPIPTTP